MGLPHGKCLYVPCGCCRIKPALVDFGLGLGSESAAVHEGLRGLGLRFLSVLVGEFAIGLDERQVCG